MMRNKILFTLFFSFSALAEKAAPYEECDWTNREFTEEIIQNVDRYKTNTEAGAVCLECSSDDQYEGYGGEDRKNFHTLVNPIAEEYSDIPDICFYAGMIRSTNIKGGPKGENYFFCQDVQKDGKKETIMPTLMSFSNCTKANSENCRLAPPPPKKPSRSIYRRRYCLSQDYVQMTAKAFNEMAECFEFTPQEKRNLFSLFKHESSFMLNSKSSTGARCYGQLTTDVYKTINRYIFYSGKVDSWLSQSSIYEKAAEKCPFLNDEDKILRQPFEKKLASKTLKLDGKNGYDQRLTRALGSVDKSFTCAATRDPYTCFFYSMYNYKLNDHAFFNAYHKIPKSNLDAETKNFFKLPSKINEIISIQGKITKNGRTQIVDWIIESEKELKNILSQGVQWNKQDLKVRVIPLFDFNDLKQDVVFRSYNGGMKVSTSLFPAFMERMKSNIASSGCINDKHCRKYREQLLRGQLLDADFFNRYFSAFLKKKKSRGESAEYIDRINEDHCYMRNKGNNTKGLMKSRLSEFEHAMSPQDVDDFVEQIGKLCPAGQEKGPLKCPK